MKTLFLDRLVEPDNVRVLQLPADPRLSLQFLEVWNEMSWEEGASRLRSGHPGVGLGRQSVVGGGGGGGGGVLTVRWDSNTKHAPLNTNGLYKPMHWAQPTNVTSN